jgi:hypothetical protein
MASKHQMASHLAGEIDRAGMYQGRGRGLLDGQYCGVCSRSGEFVQWDNCVRMLLWNGTHYMSLGRIFPSIKGNDSAMRFSIGL